MKELVKTGLKVYCIVLVIGLSMYFVFSMGFAITSAEGSSMSPTWSEEDTLTVIDLDGEVTEGDIVSYDDSAVDKPVVHRITTYSVEGNKVVIDGDNPNSLTRTYTIQEFENKYNGKIIYAYDIKQNEFNDLT